MVEYVAAFHGRANAADPRAFERGFDWNLLKSEQARDVSTSLLLRLVAADVSGGPGHSIQDRVRSECMAAHAAEFCIYRASSNDMYRYLLLFGELGHGARTASGGAGEGDSPV